ncbi:hypothetical protein CROQUDRAFT_654772 [Cronartium quercuum f. sp. fusiforme G11]|uniref:Nuclear pore complex protein Nup85 n=1 Tax=Cronartium quercuum f. sp. fusiforme G11 TaxID=708437 RepID=A0A9P6NMX8_9BASI|nr:hypothetical protein CROQUDRAFT_654772 [Cronartium quercuum f. sp. fusiforme G11]
MATPKPIQLQLHPVPIQSTSKTPSRTCHSIFDPKRNALALAVVADKCVPKRPKSSTLLSVAERSLYLANSLTLHPSRRSLITRSYEVFCSLHRVAAMCEEEEEAMDDHRQSPSKLPSTSQMQYYWRIGEQYVVALRDYLNELEQDEEGNAEEVDVVIQMIEAMSLFVLVHMPSDGRGDGIFAEQLLDWVNRSNPQPPKQEGEELSSLAVPYEHVNFWPYIHACVIRGHLAQATALLVPYTKTSNATLNQLMTVTIALMRSTPRSSAFTIEHQFTNAVHRFRKQVDQILSSLDSEMEIVSATEEKRSDGQGFDEDELLHFQASFKILLEIISGDEERVSEACYDWREAIGAHLLWVHPTCRRDGLGPVMKTVTENWPIDSTSISDQLASSILRGEIDSMVHQASKLDIWLACHLADLLDKLGAIPERRLRDFYVLEYVDTLSVDQGLWRLMIDYLETAHGGKELIRQIIRRLIVEDLEHQSAGAGVGMVELKEVCEKHAIEEELARSARIMARSLVKQRKYGVAVAYAVTAGDLKMISRISDLLLDEYITQGPEEFARLVDEIPNSLLHPTAPTIRPGLFFDQKQEDLGGAPNIHSSRLVFLSRYRDMHSYYARGERRAAAETLVGLLTGEVAPKEWWAVCLIDVIPLLEDEEMLVGLAETYELLRCLEAVVGDEAYLRYLRQIVGGGNGEEQLGVVRYALSRHLARCLTSKY